MSARPIARPIARLGGLAPYRAQPVPSVDLLRLDGSEGTRPDAVFAAGDRDWSAEVRVYPKSDELAAALAERQGVSIDRIVIGAGADELLDRCCRAYLDRERTMILPSPTFAMFGHYAHLAGAQVLEVPWPGEEFPTGAVVETLDERTGIVVCVSPNNPTGAVVTKSDLERISQAAGDALIVLDHAYVEYSPEDDLTAFAADLENVCVVRTFSKAWGLAGARVGWAVAPPEVADTLRTAGGPYPVAGPSLALAVDRLETGAREVERHVERVGRNREGLLELARDLELPTVVSRANFVCFDAAERAPYLFEALLARGILARSFDASPGRVRLAIPEDPEVFLRLMNALRAALSPDALLFDLDGVIADVSESQRVCIRETAASFGVAVEAGEVSELILAGDANDDWAVTERILARGGKQIPFETVKARYQSLYLGESERPGLREREKPLISPGLLARLAERKRLAVVTGRPRAEAKWFLDRHGFDGIFDAVIAAEDAARKPDPAPTRLALERLGVRRAWMIGDTPDDMKSAVAAGVLAVGSVAPDDDPIKARRQLAASGAAFILNDPEDLRRWIR